jgi:hypothetical protein
MDLLGVTRVCVEETAAKRGQDYITLFVEIDAASFSLPMGAISSVLDLRDEREALTLVTLLRSAILKLRPIT